MRARVVVFANAALVAAGGALGGCGGSVAIGTTGTGGGGTGGAATAGTGGAATAGTGGSTADTSSGFLQPACPITGGSTIYYDDGTCTPADLQLCYKPCGVENIGVRSVTCLNGTFAQMSGCLYDPSRDHSCYKIPTVANTACPPGDTLQDSMPCDVPHCTVCNSMQGIEGGGFLDSGGAPHTGSCVCQPPNASGTRTWSCETERSWPCPWGMGCGGTGATFVSEPACPSPAVRGGTCTAPTDLPFCYLPCGPQNTGVRLEICTGSVYGEKTGCAFDPNKDYSCYKIPTAANAACPAGVTPQSSMVCDVPTCTLCNSLGGVVGGGYLDGNGPVTEAGFCVCQPPDASGTRTWSCASYNEGEWPCPRGQGC